MVLGTPGLHQMCQTGAEGGVTGGDGCSYLEPDDWGLVQNTLFINLFKPAYIPIMACVLFLFLLPTL